MENTVKPNGTNKPKWWTDGLEASWDKAKAETIAGWKQVVAGEKKVATELDEGALAFGHGARKVYQEIKSWGSDLEEKLKTDWKATAATAEKTWDQVSAAVKHGWERGVDAVKAEPPKA